VGQGLAAIDIIADSNDHRGISAIVVFAIQDGE
jgi:hypothetical protein